VGGTITQGTGTASGYTLHTFTSSGSFDLSSVDLSSALSATVNNAIVGTGDLIYNGPGVLALTATNTYSGTTTIAPSATLQIGRNTTLGSLGAGNVANNGTLAFNRSDTYTLVNTISGSGNVVQYGPGELNLAGTSHNAGGWRLAGGSITSGTMASGNFTVEEGSISAVLAGSGTLTKSTSGVVTLTGTNTYAGATTVSGGTLLVNGNHASASGAISVTSDATLGGVGTVGGAMTVNTGGTVSPGDGLGTFTVNNNVTFAAGGQMNWQITDATGSAGTGWDVLTIGGSLDITATSANPFKVNLWSVLADGSNGPIANYEPTLNVYTWTLATTTGGITGYDASDFQVNSGATNGTNGLISTSSTSGFSVILSQSGKDLLLQWSPPTSQVLDGTSGGTTTAGFTTTTSANSLTLTNGFFVDYLVVGGGGGGGGDNGGGGGAGGYITNVGGSLLQLNTQNYTVTVGSGGNGGTANQRGSNGGNSSIFSFTAFGGGGGAGGDTSVPPQSGGSGGGGNGESGGTAAQGANRTAGQGYSGGTATFGGGAGGGGAAASGRSNVGNTGGAGGNGLQNSITGASIYYAGGGGGGPENWVNSSSAGGQGGGGEGKPGAGTAGAANTGGGGGGAGYNGSSANGGAGGSGVVIVRYEGESIGSVGGTLTSFNGNGTIGKSGVPYQVHTFNSSGSFDLSTLNLSNRLRSVLSGGIVGSGNLIFNGPGALALTASNTYSGTTTIASGSILQIGNGGTTGTLGGGSVTNNGTLRYNRSNALTLGNTISGTGSLEKLGTGTLTLSTTNTFTGGTKVSAGTLALGVANALPTNGDLTVESATFNLAGFNQSVGNVTLISGLIGNDGAAASLSGTSYSVRSGEVSAALVGTATLTKTTTGTVALSGTNTYSGATNVNAGTLRINGNNAGATGALTVASGATLGGNGTIGGAITAQSGAILAPGNSAGNLSASSDLTLATGALFQWELVTNDDTPADRGTDFDGVNVSGALSVGTGVTSQLVFNGTGSAVDFTDAFWKSPHTWLVFDNANAPTLSSPTTIFDTVTPSVDKNNVSLTSVAGLTNARFYWTLSGNDLILNYYSGVPSTATSTVTVSPSTHQVGSVGTSTLTIQLKESNGNNLTNGGAPITFASLGAGKGSIGTVFDNNNGTYTATYTAGTKAGAVDIIPTIGGVAFTQTATITLTPGAATATLSTASAFPTNLLVGGTGTSTITVQLRDVYGNAVNTGGGTVTFDALPTGKGTISAATDNNNGTFSALYTAGTTLGVVTITPKYNGIPIGGSANLTLTSELASAGTSTVTVSPSSLIAGSSATSTITIQLKAANGTNLTTGGATITFGALGAGKGSIGTVLDNNNGTYTAIYTAGTTAGSVSIIPSVGGLVFSNTATINLIDGALANAGTSIVTASPSTQIAGGSATSTLTVQLKDAFGNLVTTGGATVTFASLGAGQGSIGTVFDNNNGTYTATYTAGTTAGSVTITPKLNGTNFTQTATITLIGGAPTQLVIQAGNNQTATVGTAVAVAPSVKALDANNNPSSGVSVTFTPSAGGSINPTTAVITGANGIATLTSWTLGTISGTYTLSATITGSSPTLSTTFTATGVIEASLLSELNASLTTASALDPTLYTPGSWSAVTAALALPTTTNAEVAAKTAAIKAAIAALITKAAQTALDAAVTAVGALNPATYTPGSWAAQQGPLAAAMALPATTNAEILAKTAALNAAMAGLITKTAQSALDTVIDTAGKLNPASYSPTSWNALTAALALPATTNAQVLAKTAAINAAMASLITKETQNELDSAITATSGLNESDYTPETWRALSEALALPARNNAEALAKAEAIKAALAKLVSRDAQSALDTALAAAAALDVSNYTPSSWSALAAALALPATTKAEMEAKTAAINKALALMITKTAQSALDTAIAAAGALNRSAYSPESWNALQAALALPATTNAEVLAKAAAIQAAMTKLTASAPPKMSIQAGEGLTATVGTSLNPSPSVVIKNAYNEPVAGVEVTFTVSSGEGVVAPSSSVVTGTDGIASLTSWTLGLTTGKNTLVATAVGLNSVTFTATGTAEPGKVATVQLIHNSPVGLVDIGLNGLKLVDDMQYQNASRALTVPAQTPVRLQVTSANGGTTLAALTHTGLTARKHHLLILQGGADGKPFELMTVSDARMVSTELGAAQVIFHHGVTNGPIFTLERVTVTTPRRTEQLIASFAEYGSASSYSTQKNPEITQYQLRNGSTLLGLYLFNNMGSYEGKAVTLLATGKMGGFLQNALNLMLVDAEGKVTKASITTANEEEEATLPLQFTLYANYPNPFNPTTNLRFDLPEQAKVGVEIVDVLGRLVMKLSPVVMSAGNHKMITLDVAELPSGTYFYRVIAEGASRTYVQGSKFTLLK
jgi:autotransporter-associated beta strand protein